MPTALRLLEARERGFVPRSGELVAAAVLLAGVGAAAALGGGLLDAMRRLTAAMLAEAGELGGGWSGEVVWAAWAVAVRSAAIVGVVAAAAVVANVAQFGLVLAGEPVRMDLSRLVPGAGRMLSRRSAVRAGLGLIKAAAAACVVWAAVRVATGQAVRASGLSADGLATWMGRQVAVVAGAMAAALAAVAVVDLVYQRWQYRQDLKMTRREYLDDLRRMEGRARARRRQ